MLSTLLQDSEAADELDAQTFGSHNPGKGTFVNGHFHDARQGNVPVQSVSIHQNERREPSSAATFETAPSHFTALPLDRRGLGIETESSQGSSSPVAELRTLHPGALPFAPRQLDTRPTAQEALSEKDAAAGSPHMQDLLDRLIRVELSLFPLRDLATQMATLRSDVDFLLRAQRQQGQTLSPTPSIIGPFNSKAESPPLSQNGVTEAIHTSKDLTAQLSDLSATVAALVRMQQQMVQSPVNHLLSPQSVGTSPLLPIGQMYENRPPMASRRLSVQQESPIPSQYDRLRSSLPASFSRTSLESSSNSIARKWAALGTCIEPLLLQSLLQLADIATPTKIQLKAIPCLLQANEDIIAQCASSLDSILTYALPALQLCLQPVGPKIHALIIVSTIDRASQCHRICNALGQSLGIRSSLAISRSVNDDKTAIQRLKPHILVGLPQTLMDLVALRSLDIENSLRLLVLDEADSLLSSNQGETVQSLARLLPKTTAHATAIVGQHIQQDLLNFASQLDMREPVRVLVRKSMTSSSVVTAADDQASRMQATLRGLRHFFLYVAIASRSNKGADQAWKLEATVDLIEDLDFRQAIIYCATTEAVDSVTYKLASRGVEALSYHDSLGTSARNAVLNKFRSAAPGSNNQTPKKILIVLDSLCRTLSDLHQVPLVVNFDLPEAVEEFVYHASYAIPSSFGRAGSIVNIVTSQEDIAQLHRIEAYFGIRVQQLPNSHNTII